MAFVYTSDSRDRTFCLNCVSEWLKWFKFCNRLAKCLPFVSYIESYIMNCLVHLYLESTLTSYMYLDGKKSTVIWFRDSAGINKSMIPLILTLHFNQVTRSMHKFKVVLVFVLGTELKCAPIETYVCLVCFRTVSFNALFISSVSVIFLSE